MRRKIAKHTFRQFPPLMSVAHKELKSNLNFFSSFFQFFHSWQNEYFNVYNQLKIDFLLL